MTIHVPPPNPLRHNFVDAMSHVASAVNVVTTDGAYGRGGVTVTAMSSVSADGPEPQLLICLHAKGRVCSKVLRNRIFCVNLLRADQHPMADHFAGRQIDKQTGARYESGWATMQGGAVRLPNPLAAFGCRIRQFETIGTHHVIFGTVQDVFVSKPDPVLIYANRRYGRLEAMSA